MMHPESPTHKSTLPMDQLSADWLTQQILSSIQNNETAAAIKASSPASLKITIVMTEEIPGDNLGTVSKTTKTVERKLELSLTLPQSYAHQKLKSINVKLHQNVPKPAPHSFEKCSPTGPLPVPASSSISPATGFFQGLQGNYQNNSVEAQRQYQQAQHHLFYDNNTRQVLPPAVVSSQDFMANSNTATAIDNFVPLPDTVSSSAPHPETVSSSHSIAAPNVAYSVSNNTGNKRRRTSRTNEASHYPTAMTEMAAPLSSSSLLSSSSSSSVQYTSRKKRKQTFMTCNRKQ